MLRQRLAEFVIDTRIDDIPVQVMDGARCNIPNYRGRHKKTVHVSTSSHGRF
ncbi:MAG: hypothetical protein QOK44_612 [Betaproteobacteria bacterium]|nr:hypothetical protein [Betaproteobacteria bacterium]